jgi:hypothetical protein
MSNSFKTSLLAGAFVALSLVPSALHAQNAASDSLAFPRQFVKWVVSSQGDSAYSYSGAMLKESMKSAAGVNEMAGRIATRFGAQQGTDAEIQFDEGPLKVYIHVMRFSLAPEPAAWVVAYNPATKVVERASFGSLTNAKTRYPQAKLP